MPFIIHILLHNFSCNPIRRLGDSSQKHGRGAKCQILSSFAPQEETLGYYFQLGTFLRAIETHDLLSFLWSIFCKWPVINVTLLT